MIPRTLILRDVADANDAARCKAAARAAGHSCAAPTQIIEEVPGVTCVGYASIGSVTVLTGWLHDDRVSAAEAGDIIRQLENIVRETTSASYIVMPCTHDCRMLGELEKIGWRKLPSYYLFMKRLNNQCEGSSARGQDLTPRTPHLTP